MSRLNHRLAATGLILSVILIGACAGGPDSTEGDDSGVSWSRDPKMLTVEIVVDLLSARDGRIPVEVTAIGGRPTRFAIQSAWSDGYSIHDLRFTDGAGQTLPHKSERGGFRLERTEDKVVKAEYVAQLGGEGRHGKQGVLAQDHALFDGRLFLLPQGAVSVGSARIRFDVPQGWSVGSPFREEDSWYYVDAFEPELTAAVLGASCMGVGFFEHSTREMGETEVRVASYAGWEDEHKQRLADKTFRMLEQFHETLGFDLRAPYSVVWVPKQGRDRVFGGSFANGTCYENPTDSLRNWELLAHRIAHAMNHYRPSGFRIRDDRDSWFDEGWASYMEATATRGAGLAEDESRWRTLYSSYRRTRARSPERDLPLSREKQARGETKEFLHYVKAPLAVKMLEHLVLERSDRNLEQFMAAMWQRYGWFENAFPVQEELEAFTGASFADFWALIIDARGDLIPVWEEYLTPLRLAFLERTPAASVGGEPLQADYLYYLAWSGKFRSFEAIGEFLVQEEERRRELIARGVRLYPDRIRENLYAMTSEDRYALARLEAAYPLESLSGVATPSTGQPSGGEIRLVPNTADEDGRIFAELLAYEQRGDSSRSAADRPGFMARTENLYRPGGWSSRLAFADDETIEVLVSRSGNAGNAEVVLLSGDRVQAAKKIEIDPEGRMRALLGADERPSGNRVIVLRLDTEEGEPVTRAFWQRAAASWAPLQTVSPEER